METVAKFEFLLRKFFGRKKLVTVYEEVGEGQRRLLGELELQQQDVNMEIKEIVISEYSEGSQWCPPLAVMHTINSTEICFKLEAMAKKVARPLSDLHAACLTENKTAVAHVGDVEIQLVAMRSGKHKGQNPCFWGFNVASSLYDSRLVMLNRRCLGIVFDLDETLLVANTLRSFEDRIDSLEQEINSESDPQRVSGMLAELKQYVDDRSILKQYVEDDPVTDSGKDIRSTSEAVFVLSGNHQDTFRHRIWLQDRNIILTRIDPEIRDTSVLVRLRPAWEDLRSYLTTAGGRKRFEVFVCTVAERDYALEMWRLLDPDSILIDPSELLDRIVCIKSGSKKSLSSVFEDGNCHPKMALVVDNCLEKWDKKDQPQVHVVPKFTPYFAPQDEANNTVPVLSLATDVACKVRYGFFTDFGEGLIRRISKVEYEDGPKSMPSPPDVSRYLVSKGMSLFPRRRGCIISPEDRCCRWWEVVLAVLSVYSMWVFAFEMGFIGRPKGLLSVIDIIVDMFFIIDSLLLLAFWVAHRGTRTYWAIASLTMDIVTAIPVQLLMIIPLKHIFALANMLRLWRLRRVDALFARLERNWRLSNFWIKCLKLLAIKLFMVHYAGCVFFMLTVNDEDPKSTSIGMFLPNFSPDNIWENYVTSLYWAMTTLSTVGYGDIHPTKAADMIFATFLIAISVGIGFYSSAIMSNLQASGAPGRGSPTRVYVRFPEITEDVKIVMLPDSLEELLKIGYEIFSVYPKKVMIGPGDVEEITVIQDRDMLTFCSNEWKPKPSEPCRVVY